MGEGHSPALDRRGNGRQGAAQRVRRAPLSAKDVSRSPVPAAAEPLQVDEVLRAGVEDACGPD